MQQISPFWGGPGQILETVLEHGLGNIQGFRPFLSKNSATGPGGPPAPIVVYRHGPGRAVHLIDTATCCSTLTAGTPQICLNFCLYAKISLC